MSNFEAATRWAALAPDMPAEVVAALEDTDRDLEQYLYGPPHAVASPVWWRLNAGVWSLSVLGFGDNVARWERERGGTVTYSFTAEVSSVAGAAARQLGIAIPHELWPADAAVDGRIIVAGGTAQRYSAKAPTSDLPGLTLEDRRPSINEVILSFYFSGTTLSTITESTVVVGNILTGTAHWRPAV